MEKLKHLFEANQVWADSIKRQNPDFFHKLSKQQSPEYLWIGCSDSRVPETQITNLQPGEIFVHRNIANIVVNTDVNCLSVIQYAVDLLNIKHIIICGHYGCGGIETVLLDKQKGVLNRWLEHIRLVYEENAEKFVHLNHDQKLNLLCELNVKQQVENVSKIPIVQNAWKQGNNLTIHGWIYDIDNGVLRDLDCRKSIQDVCF